MSPRHVLRRSLDILGMLLLGVAALAVPAWLFEVRTTSPVAPSELAEFAALTERLQDEVPAPDDADYRRELARGLRGSVWAASSALRAKRRSEATHALDAAARVAKVAKHAMSSPEATAVADGVESARHHLQDGRPDRAIDSLEGSLDAARRLANRPPQRADSQVRLEAYVGATLINAHGARIGEVQDIVDGEDGAWQLVVAVGGRYDLFGFFDWSPGQPEPVPAEALLFGPPGTLGETMVAMPAVLRLPWGS